MEAETVVCTEHSGCMARIDHLETNNQSQWHKIDKVNEKVDRIFTRVNVILGGVCVACILLVINIALK